MTMHLPWASTVRSRPPTIWTCGCSPVGLGCLSGQPGQTTPSPWRLACLVDRGSLPHFMPYSQCCLLLQVLPGSHSHAPLP